MKRPQLIVRMFFVLIALISVPLGWVAYQLNWIRERHEFLSHQKYYIPLPMDLHVEAPWSLRLFGESPQWVLTVDSDLTKEAERLFPEAKVFDEKQLELRHPIHP